MISTIRPLAAHAVCAALLALATGHALAERPSRGDQRGPMKFDRTYGREQAAIKKALSPVVADAARATHRVLSNGRHCALATAVHPDGWLLTKASELTAKEKLEIEFAGGLKLPATVTDRLDAYDLALIKVEAAGLKPVSWSDRPVPAPGSFLAAPGPSDSVAAVGVASVGLRNLYEPPKGYMGVRLRQPEGEAAVIEAVFEGGAADKAGIKKEDVIVAVDGESVKGREELVARVSKRRPGDEIRLKVRRGEEEIEIPLTLMDRRESLASLHQAEDPMVLMSGRLSRHRHSFFNVFQHDLVLAPEECGGPLVDLDGHVVGLDIARSGRVESLAIPAADLKNLLSAVTTGKFTLPDLDALRDTLKKADLAVLAAQEARAQAEQSLKRAHELHATLPAPPPTTAEVAPKENQPPPAIPTAEQAPAEATPPPASMPASMP
jgi:serine protease Do